MTNNMEQSGSTSSWFDAHKGETFRLLAGTIKQDQSNRLSDALKFFNKALETNSNNIWTIAHRGLTYRQLTNFQKAEQDFQAVIRETPGNPWGYAQLGETYRLWLDEEGSRDPEHELAKKAIEQFNHAISLYKEYAWVHAHLGATYYRIKQYSSAKDYLNNAIEMTNKSYAWAYAYLGSVYHEEDDKDNSEKNWKTAERLDPRVLPDNYQYDMALLSELAGKFDEAIEQYNKQLQEDPNNPLALYGIALATVRNQEPNEAQIEKTNRATTVLQQYNDKASLYMLSALAYLQGESDRAREYIIQAASVSLDDVNQTSIPFSGIKRALAVNDLSWLGLDRDEGFQALIS